MTLSKQLMLMIAGLFVLMFIGTFTISLNNTRNYLLNQLQSHAQDTATSLALSVSPHVLNNDMPTVNSMIDAIFDRGYYSQIIIEDNDGKALYERNNPVKIEHVPAWFIELIPLDTPPSDALLMAGWNQVGSLLVATHPGYAYDELWRNASGTLLWFSACAAVSMLLAFLLLRMLLKPLQMVEQQAEAICNREYPIQEKLPWTRELRRVVLAMNRMAERIGQMFREQAELTETLRKQVYLDPVTGLGNRRYFDTQMKHLLDSPEEFSQGALLLIQLRNFKAFNDKHGYELGDELLRQTTAIIRDTCVAQDIFAAHLAGADFALLVSNVVTSEAEKLAHDLLANLNQLYASGIADAEDIAHIGIAPCVSGNMVSDVIAQADLALRNAQQKGPNQWHLLTEQVVAGSARSSAANWKKRLGQHLQGDSLLANFQPVVESAAITQVLHYEMLLRAREADGSLISAGVLLPMAERVGLAQQLDQRAIELAVRNLKQLSDKRLQLAINLAPGSLVNTEFMRWLDDFLAKTTHAARLIFEIPEYGVLRNIEVIRDFAQRLEQYGSGLAIDHFGRGFTSFAYLHTLKIRYLKVDGSYIRNIDTDKDNQFFVRALAKTAHEIEVKIIAEAVETQEEQRMLSELNMDGLQGYLIGRPTALIS